jgi:hypothetical protein
VKEAAEVECAAIVVVDTSMEDEGMTFDISEWAIDVVSASEDAKGMVHDVSSADHERAADDVVVGADVTCSSLDEPEAV